MAVLFEAAVEGGSGEAERARGGTDVAGVAGHGFLDEELLDVLEAHLLERDAAFAGRAQREVAHADRIAARHERRALDRVVELADVARPRVVEQGLERRRLEAPELLAVTAGVPLEEVERQRRNVFPALGERRDAD